MLSWEHGDWRIVSVCCSRKDSLRKSERAETPIGHKTPEFRDSIYYGNR